MKQVKSWKAGTLVLGKLEIITPGITGLSVGIANEPIPVVGFGRLGPKVENKDNCKTTPL